MTINNMIIILAVATFFFNIAYLVILFNEAKKVELLKEKNFLYFLYVQTVSFCIRYKKEKEIFKIIIIQRLSELN